MTVEEVTVAIPFPVCKGNAMRIICAVYQNREGFKVESFTFLGVSLGFFNLSDHSRVHFSSPIEDRGFLGIPVIEGNVGVLNGRTRP
ncbi:MAG: hypothetical protein ABSF99_00005, partial [Anaerolineales bacterium]